MARVFQVRVNGVAMILRLERQLARWPRRWAYLATSFPVAFLLSFGLLVVESTFAHTVPGATALATALRTHPELYGYVFGSTAAVLAALGFRIGAKEDRLQQISATDALTGLPNRRRLQAEVIEEVNRADRYNTPLALLLIDLDHLKDVNDRYGHAQGDRALQAVAEALRQTCRTTDLPARHGGDEFAVLAVNTTAREAEALAQRILDAVRRLTMQEVPVTVSIGVSDLDRATVPGFEGLAASADEALYRAKAQGRATAVAAPEAVRSVARLRLVTPLPAQDDGRRVTRG